MNPIETESAVKSAQIFKLVRKDRSWTQVELAKMLGISQSALSKLEAAKLVPSSLLWFHFCELAGILPESLLSGVPTRTSGELNKL